MKTKNLTQPVIVMLALIAACWIMGGSAQAEVYEFDLEAVQSQAMYERIPNLWEYFQGTKIEWTELNEAAIEPNDDETMATPVGDAYKISGQVDTAGDVNDYFMVVTSEPSTLVAELKWSGDAWLNFYIYDQALQPVTYLNEDTGSPKVLSFWQWAAGTYYIRVKAIEGSASYTLRFGVGTQYGETDNDAYDTTEQSLSVFNSPFKSVISDSVDPVDVYKITVPVGTEAATISLDWLGSAGSNLDFDVLGEMGAVLMTADDSSTFESLYSQNVPSGTYYLAVRAITGRAIYQLTVDAEVNLHIEIPIYEYMVPVWWPPFPELEIQREIRVERVQ